MKTKEEKKEYNRQYYLAHKEEIKEGSRQYWLAHKEERREYMCQYRFDHKEALKECKRQYQLSHKEHKRLYQITHKEELKESKRQYYLTHKEEQRESARKYRQTPEGKAARQRGNSARRANMALIANTLTCEEWYAILDEHEFKCAYCGCNLLDMFNPPTRDHVIPISKGGDNVKENIVPACNGCNSKKGAKLLE